MLYFWYYVISVINKNFQFTFRLQTCSGVFVYWPFIFLLYCIHLIRSCVFGRFLQIFNITMKSLKIVYYFFILIYALFYFFCLFVFFVLSLLHSDFNHNIKKNRAQQKFQTCSCFKIIYSNFNRYRAFQIFCFSCLDLCK